MDNTTLNPGTGGDVIRDEDIGGIKYPISKIYTGATGVDGGPVTNANPFPTSVQGSVAVTGTFWQATQPISAAALPLPTGAATEATLSTLNGKVTACNTGAVVVSSSALPAGAATEATLAGTLTTTAFQARVNTLGQKTMANSTPVVLASDQASIPVAATCSGTVAISGSVAVTGTFFQATQPVSGTVTANQGGTWTVQPGNTANTTPWLVKEFRSSTGAQSSVAGSAASVTLLASNANRLGAVINNDSTAILYIKLGATASTTSYTAKLFTDDMYEVPFGYTGVIDGIWASATGNARITELT